jgi:hypothetical protein
MPRIRTIKPDHWNDIALPSISLQAHLLWIATWNFSDDVGVFDADPLLIRSQVFPRRTDIRAQDIDTWIGQLVKARYVIPFTFNGRGYYINRTFKTHQRIDKPQPSKIPNEIIIGMISEDSKNDQGTLPPDSRVIVEEGKVKEGSVAPLAPPAPPSRKKRETFVPPSFEELKAHITTLKGDTRKPGCWPADRLFNEAQKMLLHYTSNGWIQGKGKPIVDWKAAAGTWIMKALEGTFAPPENRQSPAAVRPAQMPALPDKMIAELNYHYGRYLEGHCTEISLDPVHYDYLWNQKRIDFPEDLKSEIKGLATKMLQEKGVVAQNGSLISLSKRLAVMHFFKVLKNAGAEAVFQ